MNIPKPILDQLNAVDIRKLISHHVPLKPRGPNRSVGLCPFHREKSPSFTIFKNRFHCFGCHSSGDPIAWMMKFHNLTFPDACQQLSQEFNIPLQ